MKCRILCFVMLLSATHTMNGDWIATNSSLFCAVANDCIVMEAESPWIPDDRRDGEQGHDGNASKACYYHKSVCELTPNMYYRYPIPGQTYYINSDRKAFCRIIMSCYEGTLITGPTVDAHKLCPYSHVCGHSPSSEIGDWGHSCCFSCSCKPSCRLTNNCCYKSNYTDENAAESAKWKCLTFDMPDTHPIDLYVKDTCSNGSKCHYDRYIPAISQTKQRIYVDEDCGHCNDADDVTTWTANLSCVAGAQYECKTIFRVPDMNTFEWMAHYFCSGKIIKTCDPRYNNEAVKKACHETNAMVLAGGYLYPIFFANIFCVACNYYLDYRPQDACSIFNNVPPTASTIYLNMLLDLNAKRNSIQPNTAAAGKDKCGAYTLKNVHKPGCRMIFCPDGMVRVNDDSCQYLGKIWYKVIGSMKVSLHPMHGTTVPASLLTSIASKDHISKWMRSPCLPLKNAHAVYMLTSTEALVDEIVIRIITEEVKVLQKPGEYISRWAKCFDDPWHLVLGVNLNISAFSPSFYPDRTAVLPDTYTRIYPSGIHFGFYDLINLILTKSYFCNQVEMISGEFENNPETDRIRLLHNNVTLGNNTFNRIDDNVRVCVQDYLYSDISADSTGTIYSRALLVSALLIHFLFQC